MNRDNSRSQHVCLELHSVCKNEDAVQKMEDFFREVRNHAEVKRTEPADEMPRRKKLIVLSIAKEIHGLGIAGASGLLSLMYPDSFATVDQFVVKALWQIPDLPESNDLKKMKPENLSLRDGVILINIMGREKRMKIIRFLVQVFGLQEKLIWFFGL